MNLDEQKNDVNIFKKINNNSSLNKTLIKPYDNYNPHFYNWYRKEELMILAKENFNIYKRLNAKNSSYTLFSHLRDYEKAQYYKKNHCKYPSIDFYRTSKSSSFGSIFNYCTFNNYNNINNEFSIEFNKSKNKSKSISKSKVKKNIFQKMNNKEKHKRLNNLVKNFCRTKFCNNNLHESGIFLDNTNTSKSKNEFNTYNYKEVHDLSRKNNDNDNNKEVNDFSRKNNDNDNNKEDNDMSKKNNDNDNDKDNDNKEQYGYEDIQKNSNVIKNDDDKNSDNVENNQLKI